MPRENGTNHRSKIGCHRQVPVVMQVAIGERRPLAINLPTPDRASHDPHYVSVAMVCAAIAVFAHRSAEFRHHENDSSGITLLPKPIPKLCEPLSQLTQVIRQGPLHASFVHM